MTDQLNIVLHVEGNPNLVIESNINLRPTDEALFAEIWQLPTENQKMVDGVFAANKCLKHFYGRHALTDAVLHLSKMLGEPVAHKIRKRKGGTVWL